LYIIFLIENRGSNLDIIGNLIDLRTITGKKFGTNVQNRTIILMLIPMFLIVSSSVYPAIVSTVENKEMKIIVEVLAQLKKNNIDTSNIHATMPVSESQDIIAPSSPTPINPTFSATPPTFRDPSATPMSIQQQDEVDNGMVANVINPGDQVHTVWEDETPGKTDIFYKRDGADFDPSTVNFSEDITT
jgi:hypothetical protein